MLKEQIMKKFIFFGVITLLLVLLVFALLYINANPINNELIQSKIELVDEKIHELIASDMYAEASFQERENLVSTMLMQLEQDRYIFHLSYDKTGGLFSFQYADRTLGGVRIDDFSQQVDELPIN